MASTILRAIPSGLVVASNATEITSAGLMAVPPAEKETPAGNTTTLPFTMALIPKALLIAAAMELAIALEL